MKALDTVKDIMLQSSTSHELEAGCNHHQADVYLEQMFSSVAEIKASQTMTLNVVEEFRKSLNMILHPPAENNEDISSRLNTFSEASKSIVDIKNYAESILDQLRISRTGTPADNMIEFMRERWNEIVQFETKLRDLGLNEELLDCHSKAFDLQSFQNELNETEHFIRAEKSKFA